MDDITERIERVPTSARSMETKLKLKMKRLDNALPDQRGGRTVKFAEKSIVQKGRSKAASEDANWGKEESTGCTEGRRATGGQNRAREPRNLKDQLE